MGNIWWRRFNIVMTVGGGFIGLIVAMPDFVALRELTLTKCVVYAVFMALYCYGIFVGLRLGEGKESDAHLAAYYCLQVPFISSPLASYHFTSGFYVAAGIIGGGINASFRLGSEWHVSFLQPAPWGIGVNFFALAIVLILILKKRPDRPVEIPVTHDLQPPADAPPTPEAKPADRTF